MSRNSSATGRMYTRGGDRNLWCSVGDILTGGMVDLNLKKKSVLEMHEFHIFIESHIVLEVCIGVISGKTLIYFPELQTL